MNRPEAVILSLRKTKDTKTQNITENIPEQSMINSMHKFVTIGINLIYYRKASLIP